MPPRIAPRRLSGALLRSSRRTISDRTSRALSGSALALILLVANASRAADNDIRLATIGYLPDRPKVASVIGTAGSEFALKDAKDGSPVLHGTLSATVTDPDTKDQIRYADFSTLTTPGNYFLEIPGVGRTLDFPISADVYQQQLVTAMLGFYGWRSGMAVELTHRGQTFRQGPGHLQDGLLDYLGQPGVKRDGSRGWYDAGDYGKYTVNGAFTLGMMLRGWEMFTPTVSRLTLPIPEAGGELPDFLDEVKWEYDWLTTMQYSPTDGQVSHKLTSLKFADFIMPEADTTETFYSPSGSAAVADFVAAMAQGSRVYRPYDAALADQWLAMAKISYQWLTSNPADVQPKLTDFSTGAYTTPDADDRLWAAAELWETTGDAAALADFETRANAGTKNPSGSGTTKVDLDFDWSALKNLGIYTYLLSRRAGKNQTLVNSLTSQLLQHANTLVTNRNASGYGRALTSYYWGVNGSVARSCLLLQVANRLQSDPRLVDTCADQISHLYGRNTYNRSYVTGEGKDPPLHPHHRPSAADGVERPFPGLLVGGASKSATGWLDEEENYEVNEVAINWNGALVFALAGFLPENSGTTAAAGGGGAAGSGNTTNSGSGGMGQGGASNGSVAVGGSSASSRVGGAGSSASSNPATGGVSASNSATTGGLSSKPVAAGGSTASSNVAAGGSSSDSNAAQGGSSTDSTATASRGKDPGMTNAGRSTTLGSPTSKTNEASGCTCRTTSSRSSHSFGSWLMVIAGLCYLRSRRR